MNHPFRLLVTVALAATLTSCAAPDRHDSPAGLRTAEISLRDAGHKTNRFEDRAASYLDAAFEASEVLKHQPTEPVAVRIFDRSCAELSALLYSDDHEKRFAKGPVDIPGRRTVYRLHFANSNRTGVWPVTTFNRLKPAAEVDESHARQRVHVPGLGGAVVGIRHEAAKGRREPFEPVIGFTAPVTATLDFHAGKGFTDAVLTLNDPSETPAATIDGRKLPLSADFTAPLAYYPLTNELIAGLLAMIQVEKHLGRTGLHMLQPYNPDRIPVIFVHGLASTAQMWLNAINDIEADPALRGKYQFWLFQYPTGNPMSYSALRLREELEKAREQYGLTKGVILVGHSMGGLVSRLQSVNTGRAIWDANLKGRADALYAKVPADSILKRGLILQANPQVSRLIFICVPHRGSEMALGSIGRLGTSLISLPAVIVKGVESAVGGSIKTVLGTQGGSLPTSIQSLSPNNPTLKVLDKLPIQAPHHSIIGDRGRGDTPNSSDGIVPYWSSHLASAQSETIVPGPHGSYDRPETIAEIRRILKLHLQERNSHAR